MEYTPPKVNGQATDYKIGDRVSFKGAVKNEGRVYKGSIENIQYIIKPDGVRELMPIDLQYIVGRDSSGGRTLRNRRNRRRSRRRR